eukprot:TRINITY_DN29740_c0_g1_i1.p1 TRINITY_DN29740_c0_g1~~TRINITY_DN29740_c0_g1_i1.p1  ORF type:complete len:114 (-),score=46.79 TRINITY_DN29740_c0_g1_i1:7-348(-)
MCIRDRALSLSLLARGTTNAFDPPTQCMSLKKYVILLVARARVHADRITKSRRYEIRVKYSEVPRTEREVYEKIITHMGESMSMSCLLYTSDAADDLLCVDLGGRRHFNKKNN